MSPRACGVCCAAMFCMLGCRTGPLDEKAVRDIFQGFSFAGETNARSEERLRPATNPFPHSVEPGRFYVFNHPRPVDIVVLATRALPGRIGKAGCIVMKAPSTPADFAYPDAGDPLFSISFQCGATRYRLTSRYNLRIATKWNFSRLWSPSDFILHRD